MFVTKQTLQKLLSSSVRMNATRQALTLSARPAMFAASVASRGFSDHIGDGAKKLKRALEKEIKYENENYAQLEDIETFLNESGFTFNEENDGIFMSLTKQVGNKVVEVTFEARQPIPDDQQFSDQENEGDDEEAGPETE